MSKRVTSLLVGALAVLLLGAPAQAQAVKKTFKPSKVIPAYFQQLTLKVDLATNPEFRKLDRDQQERILEEVVNKKRERGEKEYGILPNAAIAAAKQLPAQQGKRCYGLKQSFRDAAPRPMTAPRMAGEATDANGIITSPAEGETKFYARSGMAYFVSGYSVSYEEQSGYAEVVECEDGTVYIKDIISHYNTGAWVKGTKEGNTITFAKAQPVNYSDSYGATLSVYWGSVTEDGNVVKGSDDITFQVEGDVISLVGSTETNIITVFWDDDDSWSGYGDWETVLTYDASYNPTPTVLVTPPEGLETQKCKLTATQYSSSGTSAYSANVEVGIDGNDYYIQGMFKSFANAWIKGTLADGVITFPKLQFIGVYAGSYNMWLIGVTETEESYVIDDFKMEYDAETKTLKSLNDALANAAEDEIYYLTWIGEISIPLTVAEEAVAQTGDPINTLPYTNGFNTDEEIAAFGIIDSNDDDNTWIFDDYDYSVTYYYSSTDDADEWLVSPAIYLESGKIYHFAIDASAASSWYPERLEVKMGKEPKASAMTLQVLEPTVVDWTSLQTLENEGLKVEETGYYHIGVHAISDADCYYLTVDNFLIEEGAQATAPSAVTNLTVESLGGETAGAVINFTAPSTAINGNPLTENIAKIEIYRDGVVVKTFENVAPGEEITYVDQDNLTLGLHEYMVLPYGAEGYGEKSNVVEVFVSVILTVPYIADFSNASTFGGFAVIDANEDGSTWSYNSNYGCAASYYNTLQDADDYLVTMPVKLKGGANYVFTANLRSASSMYPERFEVVMGKEATFDALTTVIIPETDLSSTDPADYSAAFTVEEDGEYYIAIHDISDADMFAIYVFSLSVQQELTASSPKAPRLGVQPDPYGLEKAVVTVTAPATSMDGTKLQGNLAKLVVYRDGLVIKTYENLKPGDINVFVDENIAGAHSYNAVVFDAEGNHGQMSEKVSIFTGLDTPASPSNIIAAETVDGVNLSWNPVSTGENGGIIIPEEVTYKVYNAHQEETIFGTMWVLDDVAATTTGTSVFVPFDNTVDQTTAALFVSAINEQGESSASGSLFFIGQPYQMPYAEHFGSSFVNNWMLDYSNTISLSYTDDCSDEDGSAILCESNEAGEFASFTSGKIAMQEGNPTLLVDVKGEGAAKNRFMVKVIDANGKTNLVTSVPVTNEFKTVKVSLADFASDPFIKIMLYVDIKGTGNITFDNVKVLDLLEYNLTANIEAPKTVKAGETAKVNVVVKNQGERGAKDFTVKLLAGDKQLLNEKVTEELGSFATKEFAVDFATTIFDKAEDITLRAEVEYDLELDDEDNAYETVISIKQSSAAQPENVTAQRNGSDVTLSWNAPSSSTSEKTEDFEDSDAFPAFGIGGVDESNRYGAFGDWTVYDGNGIGVYGFNGASFENMYAVQAWQVFDPAKAGFDYTPHSGNQFMWSICPVTESSAPKADHWLISPALPGAAQTISFWYRTITDSYGAETFEVLYSTTDNKVESFTKIDSYSTTATEWTELSVDLPAGATYFAIRHTSQDIFGLLIDDVTFNVSGGSISKYNVYVDRELYDDTTATSIEIKNTTGKSFAVSAVYADGKESMPVEVILSSANQELTAIEQLTGSNQPVDVYSLDGKLVRQQTTSLQGLKGTYIINNVKVVVK